MRRQHVAARTTTISAKRRNRINQCAWPARLPIPEAPGPPARKNTGAAADCRAGSMADGPLIHRGNFEVEFESGVECIDLASTRGPATNRSGRDNHHAIPRTGAVESLRSYSLVNRSWGWAKLLPSPACERCNLISVFLGSPSRSSLSLPVEGCSRRWPTRGMDASSVSWGRQRLTAGRRGARAHSSPEM